MVLGRAALSSCRADKNDGYDERRDGYAEVGTAVVFLLGIEPDVALRRISWIVVHFLLCLGFDAGIGLCVVGLTVHLVYEFCPIPRSTEIVV